MKLELRWDPDGEPLVRVLGSLDRPPRDGKDERPRPSPVDCAIDPVSALEELGYDGLWTELVGHAKRLDIAVLRRVVEHAGRVLPTTMEQWPDPVRRSMKSVVEVPEIELPELGRFDSRGLQTLPEGACLG